MSTPSRPRLTLFVQGLFGDPLAETDDAPLHADAVVPSTLALLLARADRRENPVTGVEPRLFGLFGMDVPEGQDLPVAAVTRLADNVHCANNGAWMGVVDREWWIRADPVNLAATRNGLVLQAGLGLNRDEADRLVAELSETLAQDGWLLKAPRPECWYLKPPVAPVITTTPLARAIGQDVHALLPQGRDHKAWHTHLNEFQILLHTSPVNVAREARGALPANSVWFWGGGRLPQPGQSTWTQVWSAEPLSQGLARLSALPLAATPVDAGRWLGAAAVAGDQLVVLDALGAASGRSASLQRLEQDWLMPLLAAVHSGTLAELRLLSDAGPALLYRRAHRWRFWRRPRALAAVRAAGKLLLRFRQPLPALLYLLDGCSRRRSTSSIHGVVHACSRQRRRITP